MGFLDLHPLMLIPPFMQKKTNEVPASQLLNRKGLIMLKSFAFQVLLISALLAAPPALLLEKANSKVKESTASASPDRIDIDVPHLPGADPMPSVEFYHDLHTQALSNDCSICHVQKEGQLSFMFQRSDEVTAEKAMDLYHENCIPCHVKTRNSGQKSGPVTGQCRSCHAEDKPSQSTWTSLQFDRSLHYQHETSQFIQSKNSDDSENCSVCHHQYDEQEQQLFYEKDQEESCYYCHESEKSNEDLSAKKVFHDSCVNCHVQKNETDPEQETGPFTCSGCHDPNQQKYFEQLADIPRYDRNQPDMTLVTGWDAPATHTESFQAMIATRMDPVPFNHKVHEKHTETCKACHHKSLSQCSDCHTYEGHEDGDHVRLETIMHDPESQRSCIGCHDTNKSRPDCAGCHEQIPDKVFADHRCVTCHAANVQNVDLASMTEAEVAALARKASEERSKALKPPPMDLAPEDVTIGHLAAEYSPAEFPHALILEDLKDRTDKSSLAQTFHGDGSTLCRGCHHNNSAAGKFLSCQACHGRQGRKDYGRPDLNAAFHGQCITCHQEMNFKKFGSTDCQECHAEKGS